MPMPMTGDTNEITAVAACIWRNPFYLPINCFLSLNAVTNNEEPINALTYVSIVKYIGLIWLYIPLST